MSREFFIVFLLSIILSAPGCSRPEDNVILDIKNLVNKTEYDVQEALGEPDTTYTYRFLNKRYRVNKFWTNTLEVRFLNGITAEVILTSPSDIPFEPSSIEKFGLPKAAPSYMDTTATIQWKSMDGIRAINFYKIGNKNPDGKLNFQVYFNLR